MPLQDKLIHKLAIVTPSTTGAVDDYGQPVAGDPTTALVDGFLYPKKAQEVALSHQAGAELGDHNVIVKPQTVSSAAFIRFNPDDGVRYEIKGQQPHDFGNDPLLLIHVQRITSEVLAAEVS